MRISDWSSDVCSSDLLHERLAADTVALDDWPLCRVLLMNDQSYPWLILVPRRPDLKEIHALDGGARPQLTDEICRAFRALQTRFAQIGRASCRERVCQYGAIAVVAVSLKKKIK